VRDPFFESEIFREFAAQLKAGVESADRLPELPCPGCGRHMCREMGGHGYICLGFPCVFRGRRIDVSELIDSWKWNCILTECAGLNGEYQEMRARNGAREERDSPGEFYCADCHGYHLPTTEHPACRFCRFSIHKPPPEDICFDYRGWIFTPPFICMGCGIETCYRQWAFSRSCGPCDVSNSTTRRLLIGKCFAGPHRLSSDRTDAFIPADHFVDPSEREKYPPMRPMRFCKA
jgi:hypothetical protein